MKSQFPTLTAFADPGAVVAYLHRTPGDLDAKDALLGELVLAAQSCAHGELPSSLLWLGLWPGLDAIYNRRRKHFPRFPEELVSRISEAFMELVGRLDLRSVHRVAATLVRSTERDLMERCRQEWDIEGRRASEAELDDHLQHLLLEELRRADEVESQIGRRPGHGLTDSVTALRRWLRPLVGDDAELVICALVLGESQKEAGERLGLSHDATRKRLQRAVSQLRHGLGGHLSQSAAPDRVCPTPGRRCGGPQPQWP